MSEQSNVVIKESDIFEEGSGLRVITRVDRIDESVTKGFSSWG